MLVKLHFVKSIYWTVISILKNQPENIRGYCMEQGKWLFLDILVSVINTYVDVDKDMT